MSTADELFGIDLGPAGDRTEAEADEPVDAAPLRSAKTLTERLASAAAARNGTKTPRHFRKQHDKK